MDGQIQMRGDTELQEENRRFKALLRRTNRIATMAEASHKNRAWLALFFGCQLFLNRKMYNQRYLHFTRAHYL